MQLSELYLDRYMYRDNNQDLGTKDSAFVSLDSSEVEPSPIPSGGAAQDLNTGGVQIDGAVIEAGTIPTTVLDVANWGWGQTCAFSSTDLETVSWGAGSFTSAGGEVYSISAGNTGAMSAKTYIFLDLTVSETEYQTTTTSADAVGVGKVLIAVAQNAAVSATYMMSEATQLVGDNIIANSIDASKLTAGTVAVDVYLSVGSGNNIFKADTSGIYLGNATFASAPFSVNMDGDAIVNSLRRRDFHWFTLFESIDAYTQTFEGSGSVTLVTGGGGSVLYTTDNSANDFSALYKKALYQSNDFSWNKARSFKVGVEPGSASDLRASIGTGYVNEESNETDIYTKRICFRFNSGNLYAYTADGTSRTLVDLGSYTFSNHTLEAVFTPGVNVKFYVNGTLEATVTTTLPSGLGGDSDLLFTGYLETLTTAVKTMNISYYDFWQAN